jgi:hypothetical protein
MSQTIYTTCNPISESCFLFQNNGRTIPAATGFYWDGAKCWEVGFGGEVIAEGFCTTSTTTTTTTVAGFYYSAGQVICGNCPTATATVTVYSPISLTVDRYYNPSDGSVYKILSSASGPSFDVDLTGAFGDTTNCNAACGG